MDSPAPDVGVGVDVVFDGGVVSLELDNLADRPPLYVSSTFEPALVDVEGRDVAKLHLLRAFDPSATADDVPDPYFENNFGTVFDICHAGCAGLLAHIIEQHALPRAD